MSKRNIFNSIFYNGLDVSVRACQAIALQPGIRLNASWNTFKQPTAPVSGRAGIVMQRPAGSAALSWSQVTITNNNFENFGRGPANALGCIYIYSGSESSIIDSNTIKNS